MCQDRFQVRQVETPQAELRLQSNPESKFLYTETIKLYCTVLYCIVSFCMHVFGAGVASVCPMWPFSRSDIYTYHNNMIMIFHMHLNDSFTFSALYNTFKVLCIILNVKFKDMHKGKLISIKDCLS